MPQFESDVDHYNHYGWPTDSEILADEDEDEPRDMPEDDEPEPEDETPRRLTRQERLEGLADRGIDTFADYYEEK